MAFPALAAIAALTAIKGMMDRSKERRAASAQQDYQNQIGQRGLALAEKEYANRAPLREAGLQALVDFYGRGGARGNIFRTSAQKRQGAGASGVNPALVAAIQLLGRQPAVTSSPDSIPSYIPSSGHRSGGLIDRTFQEAFRKGQR